MEHYVRPEGLPPVTGYSHAVAFTGCMVAISGQAERSPACSLVQVSRLVHPEWRVEIEALAAT
jgi:enamine deaminase RidA (YjgF/YER057c/UK114 family)